IYHHQRVPLPVEQLTFWHRQSFVAGPFRGSTTRNVDPTPSLLTSSMRPRNRRTRRRVMARPSPTPGSVSRQVEARENSLNICSGSSGVIPQPVSLTSMRQLPSGSAQNVNLTSPVAVYLTAFVRRLRHTRCS